MDENQEEIPCLDITPPPGKRLCLRDRKEIMYNPVSQLDTSISTTFSEQDSEYFLTPRVVPECQKARQNALCFLNFEQLHTFIQQINTHRACITPGCRGNLVAVSFKVIGYGGAARITYLCNGCEEYEITLESSKMDGRTSEISRALQVAFIISGCTHATYVKVLRHSLGIQTNDIHSFQETLRLMYPIVKEMVDDMCTEAMNEMKEMDQEVLGSWSRAVTTADGAWMTRGRHSKNFTFSVRNYFTGALLFRKHLCQKGSDYIIKEPLYQGTSKGAEGYAARQVFTEAKKLKMKVEINWQDQDSSSSKTVRTIYPNSKVMVCGGHAGRSHLKQLQNWAKKKKFNSTMKKRLEKGFPEVNDAQFNRCHCEEKHSPGCGCLSDAFVKQSRNNFSLILSNSESAAEFAQRLRNLYHHAIDEHKWEGGECDFHSETVCSCGKCEDRNAPQCSGKEYHTRHVLTCPFHKLAYRVEIERRASMADSIVHPQLKRGHSNWMEASHNVLIRYRNKHIFLERLHYHVSTDLGLLQANLTYMRNKRGEDYHWIPELYRKMKLPVFGGIDEALRQYGRRRDKKMKKIKEERQKRRRIQLKIQRTQEQEVRKAWSDRHGGDTYGDSDDGDDNDEMKADQRQQCKCGSTTHSRTSAKSCPFNKKNKKTSEKTEFKKDGDDLESKRSPHHGDVHLDDQKFKAKKKLCKCGSTTHSRTSSKSCPLNKASKPTDVDANILDARDKKNEMEESSDDSSSPSENDTNSDDESDMLDIDNLDDDLLGEGDNCTCGSMKAHRIDCPMNTRHLYRKRLFQSFKPGDEVAVHLPRMKGKHLACRVVQVNEGRYTLHCLRGTLTERFTTGQLVKCSHQDAIPLDKWRVSDTISVRKVEEKDFVNCFCRLADLGAQPDLVQLSSDDDDNEDGTEEGIRNHLYRLSCQDVETMQPRQWLSDSVINASQLLLLQHFPHMQGLQPPTLQQVSGFQVHKGEFVQIILVNENHWCVVSNSSDHGEVNVYDTYHSKVQKDAIPTIANLVFSSLPTLKINMVDVGLQKNSWDCGVLAVAIAYDLCAGNDPSTIAYDHASIRQYLVSCLKNCSVGQFPSTGRRLTKGVKHSEIVEIYCTCRMPEKPEDDPDREDMAQCDTCNQWFHKHCVDIPTEVFAKEDVPWCCPSCRKGV